MVTAAATSSRVRPEDDREMGEGLPGVSGAGFEETAERDRVLGVCMVVAGVEVEVSASRSGDGFKDDAEEARGGT